VKMAKIVLIALAVIVAASVVTGEYMPASYAPYPADVIKARAEAAILGAFLADAATMPLHWIYDTNQIKRLVGTGVPEFFKPNSCPFYKIAEGENAIYGQQGWAYLAAGAAGNLTVPTAVEANYYELYKDGGQAVQNHWYQDASTKQFVANKKNGLVYPKCGANDDQSNAIAHQVLVTALHAGNTANLLAEIDKITRVTQNVDRAVAYAQAAARILEKILTTNITAYDAVFTTVTDLRSPTRIHPNAADAELADKLAKVLTELSKSNFDVVQEIGSACEYPFNLITGSHLIAKLDNSADSYTSAVRQTILAGGDQASRNFYVASIQGARLGNKNLLPAAWKAKTNWWARYEPAAAQLVARRK